MPLERVGVGARLVGAHPGADFAVVLKGLQHHFDVLGHIDRAKAGKNVQIGLVELDTVVGETALPAIIPVTAQNTVVFRDTNRPFNRWQGLDLFLVQGFGIPKQIDFGQPLGGTLDLVNPNRDVREILEVVHGLPVFLAVQGGIGMKNR